MMPDLDGWSVLAALGRMRTSARFRSSWVTIVDEHRRGIALGAAGYLTKPIGRERLQPRDQPLSVVDAAGRASWRSTTT